MACPIGKDLLSYVEPNGHQIGKGAVVAHPAMQSSMHPARNVFLVSATLVIKRRLL